MLEEILHRPFELRYLRLLSRNEIAVLVHQFLRALVYVVHGRGPPAPVHNRALAVSSACSGSPHATRPFQEACRSELAAFSRASRSSIFILPSALLLVR